MKDIGLVLSGGGGKGSYEIGVWKALDELGIKPRAISGTSIGAINGALYLQGDLKTAIAMWSNLDAWELIVPNGTTMATIAGLSLVQPYLSAFMLRSHMGILDPKGIRSLLEEKVDLDTLASDGTPFFVGTHDGKANRIVYQPIQQLSGDEKGDAIIASASLPGLFPPVKLDDVELSDGGWHYLPNRNLDNTPIAPVYGQGCSTILVVALDREIEINRDRYPGATITPIVPSEDLGGTLDGLLDCSAEGAERRIKLGYSDTMKALEGIGSQEEIGHRGQEILSRMEENERTFTDRRTEIPSQDIKTAMIQFNRAVKNDSFSDPAAIPQFTEEKALRESTRALLRQSEKDMLDIEVESFLQAQKDEDDGLSRTIFEAISLLSPVKSRSQGVADQGFFAGIIGRLSGKNGRISSENQQDLARAQYAAFSMIQAIQRKGLLSLELTVAANTKINALFSQVEDLRDEQRENVVDLYKSLSTVFFRLRKEILEDHERIDGLERRIELVEWLQQIRTRTFNGREYRALSQPEALICLINDFYRITGGDWSVKELLSLKEGLITLDMADDTVVPGKFFSSIGREAMARISSGLCSNGSGTEKPLLLPVIGNAGSGEKPLPLWSVETDVATLATQMLFELRQAGFVVPSTSDTDDARGELLTELSQLEDIASEQGLTGFAQDIAQTRDNVRNFIVTVPVLGGFSTGKSTLLNSHIGGTVLPTNMAPETAIATELHPTDDEEKLVVYDLDGTAEPRQFPVSALKQVSKKSERILKTELHVKSPALMAHKNIVLVDMPGFDSSNEAHNKAIQSYVSGGSAFILSVAADQGLRKSSLDMIRQLGIMGHDIEIIVTKSELRYNELTEVVSHIRNQASAILGNEPMVESVSTTSGDLDGFRKLTAYLNDQASELMVEKLSPRISKIASEMLSTLKISASGENMDIHELERKKRELESNGKELAERIREETDRIRSQFSRQLPEQIANDVRTVLSENRASLQKDLFDGTDVSLRLKGIVQQTVSRSIECRSREAFDRACQAISRTTSGLFQSAGPDGAISMDLALDDISMEDVMGSGGYGTAIGLVGLVVGGPLGGIIGGVIGAILGSRKEREAKEQAKAAMEEAMESAVSRVRSSVGPHMSGLADRFCDDVERRMDEIIKKWSHTLNDLERLLTENRLEEKGRRESLNRCISQVQSIAARKDDRAIDTAACQGGYY